MLGTKRARRRVGSVTILLFGLAVAAAVGTSLFRSRPVPPPDLASLTYSKRARMDASGFPALASAVEPWSPTASLDEVRSVWTDAAK
ncbi:MAG: hypothetical protein P4L85_27220 [Paludisphaera borealis]|uniref:hypothetical protein n=1 Tax=Paludisphaera borealis TaxID=1387353 RepID=UPI002848776F|nr:hypothetical protein [Paludisphaera borealis]MDR3623074.1 hypothetical protein [Paludisphaera borealis]